MLRNVGKSWIKIGIKLEKILKNLEKIRTYQFNFKKLHIKTKKVTKNQSRTNKNNDKPMLRIAPRARDQKQRYTSTLKKHFTPSKTILTQCGYLSRELPSPFAHRLFMSYSLWKIYNSFRTNYVQTEIRNSSNIKKKDMAASKANAVVCCSRAVKPKANSVVL